MEEIARVYADALFEVAVETDKLDAVRDQLAQFADAVGENRDLQVFLFSPYFSSAEKRDGIHRAVSAADPQLINFLELLIEKHRMPVIFRIRQRFDELWARKNRQLEVTARSWSGWAQRSSVKPTRASTYLPMWTRPSLAGWCCESATWFWTRAFAASSRD
jgi:ATP synthase F1 delta subunit